MEEKSTSELVKTQETLPSVEEGYFDIRLDLYGANLNKEKSDWEKSLQHIDKAFIALEVGMLAFYLAQEGWGTWALVDLLGFVPLLIPPMYFLARWVGFLPKDASFGLTISPKEVSWKMSVLGRRTKIRTEEIESVYLPLDGLHLYLKNGKKKEIEFTQIGMNTVNEDMKPNIRKAFEALEIPVR